MNTFEIQRFYRIWKTQLILFFFVACVLQVLALQLNAFFLSYALIPVFFLLAKGFAERYTEFEIPTPQVLRELFLLSFIVRVLEAGGLIACCQFFYRSPFPNPMDELKYHEAMVAISNYWHEYGIQAIVGSKIEYLGTEYSGYPYFGALMMQIFGENVYAVRIGNAFLSSLTVLFAYGIMRSYLDKTHAYFGAVLIAFAPIFVVYSACNFKDSTLLLAIAAALWGMSNLIIKKYWWFSCLSMVIALSLIIFNRVACVFVLLASGGVFFLYLVAKLKGSPAFILSLILIFSIVLLLWNYFAELGLCRDVGQTVERLQAGAARTLQHDSQADLSETMTKILGAPLFTLFSPFLPLGVYVNTGLDANQFWGGTYYASHAMLTVMSLLPCAMLGMAEAWRRRREFPTPILLILFFLFYKFMQAQNLLSIFSPRQSLPAIFILYLLIPLGISRLGESKITAPVINACSITMIVVYNLYRVYA